jgi:hypothetical protein
MLLPHCIIRPSKPSHIKANGCDPAVKLTAAIRLILILALSALPAAPVSANSINTVEIRATIHSDGSATVKEAWDIFIDDGSNTEWYVAKHNLDNMEILGLSVQEDIGGSVVPFETLSAWNENASRMKKAGKCGLLRASDGYEICWGFGELGHHKYTVTYTITNIVKGYQGGDAMSYNFLSDAAGGADSLNIYLGSDHFSFEYPATRIWVHGYSAASNFVDGGIAVLGNGRFLQNDYAAVLLAFDPGLLSPVDMRAENLEDIINLNIEGNIREKPKNDSFYDILNIALLFALIAFLAPAALIRTRERRKQFKSLRNAPYCRELPFDGNIGATYARLCDVYRTNVGSVIGCFLLKWLRTGQMEIAAIADYGEATIQLRAERPDLTLHEASLYRMLVAAAGQDMVLQNKDLKKWAIKNHLGIERWLLEYRAFYKNELVKMGVYEVENTEFRDTPLAKDMTLRAFGFKRYLVDFTSVHEREAREGGLPVAGRPGSDWPFQSVDEGEAREVWDQYLIFAQLFGIADRVAEQFKELCPNSFYQNDLRYIGGSLYVASIAASIAASKSFSQSMQQMCVGGFSGGGAGGGGGGGAGGR